MILRFSDSIIRAKTAQCPQEEGKIKLQYPKTCSAGEPPEKIALLHLPHSSLCLSFAFAGLFSVDNLLSIAADSHLEN